MIRFDAYKYQIKKLNLNILILLYIFDLLICSHGAATLTKFYRPDPFKLLLGFLTQDENDHNVVFA